MELAPFEAIRTVASGGAVLTAPLHEWAQSAFGEKTRVMTATGGTDICSACKSFWIEPLIFGLKKASVVTSVLSEPVYAGGIFDSLKI